MFAHNKINYNLVGLRGIFLNKQPQMIQLIEELRNTRQELLERLMQSNLHPFMNEMILAELYDVEKAIEKFETGQFGTCEISGEFLPQDLLSLIPTLKSMDDCHSLRRFYRKALYE